MTADTFNEDYGDLAEFLEIAGDVSFLLDASGHVMLGRADPDHPAADILHGWRGVAFRDTLTPESAPKFDRALGSLTSGAKRTARIEVNHDLRDAFGLPVQYALMARSDGTIIAIGRDLQGVAASQQDLIAARISTEKSTQDGRDIGATLAALIDAVPQPVFFLHEAHGTVVLANDPANSALGRDGTDTSFRLDRAGKLSGGQLEFNDGRSALAVSTIRFRRGPDWLRAVVGDARQGDTAPDSLLEDAEMAAAVTDARGRILSCNTAFTAFAKAAGMAEPPAPGSSMSTLMRRGMVDETIVIDLVLSRGAVAGYQTGLGGPNAEGEVLLTVFRTGGRDGQRLIWLLHPSNSRSGPDTHQLLEGRVGQMSLVDIIDEATVELERVCIEEALRQTNDNRAAAADLLGLSRQSLYVRLRRFGIEAKSR